LKDCFPQSQVVGNLEFQSDVCAVMQHSVQSSSVDFPNLQTDQTVNWPEGNDFDHGWGEEDSFNFPEMNLKNVHTSEHLASDNANRETRNTAASPSMSDVNSRPFFESKNSTQNEMKSEDTDHGSTENNAPIHTSKQTEEISFGDGSIPFGDGDIPFDDGDIPFDSLASEALSPSTAFFSGIGSSGGERIEVVPFTLEESMESRKQHTAEQVVMTGPLLPDSRSSSLSNVNSYSSLSNLQTYHQSSSSYGQPTPNPHVSFMPIQSTTTERHDVQTLSSYSTPAYTTNFPPYGSNSYPHANQIAPPSAASLMVRPSQAFVQSDITPSPSELTGGQQSDSFMNVGRLHSAIPVPYQGEATSLVPNNDAFRDAGQSHSSIPASYQGNTLTPNRSSVPSFPNTVLNEASKTPSAAPKWSSSVLDFRSMQLQPHHPVVSAATKDGFSPMTPAVILQAPARLNKPESGGNELSRPSRPILRFGFGGTLLVHRPNKVETDSSFRASPVWAGETDNFYDSGLTSRAEIGGQVVKMSSFVAMVSQADDDDIEIARSFSLSLSDPSNLNSLREFCTHMSVWGTPRRPFADSRRALWRVLGVLVETCQNQKRLDGSNLAAALSQAASAAPVYRFSQKVSDVRESPLRGSSIGTVGVGVKEDQRSNVAESVETLLAGGKVAEALDVAMKESCWDIALAVSSVVDSTLHAHVIRSYSDAVFKSSSFMDTLFSSQSSAIENGYASNKQFNLKSWKWEASMLCLNIHSPLSRNSLQELCKALERDTEDVFAARTCELLSNLGDSSSASQPNIVRIPNSACMSAVINIVLDLCVRRSIVSSETRVTAKRQPMELSARIIPHCFPLGVAIAEIGRLQESLGFLESLSVNIKSVLADQTQTVGGTVFTAPLLSILQEFQNRMRVRCGIKPVQHSRKPSSLVNRVSKLLIGDSSAQEGTAVTGYREHEAKPSKDVRSKPVIGGGWGSLVNSAVFALASGDDDTSPTAESQQRHSDHAFGSASEHAFTTRTTEVESKRQIQSNSFEAQNSALFSQKSEAQPSATEPKTSSSPTANSTPVSSSGWGGMLKSSFGDRLRSMVGPKQAHLGTENKFYYNEKLGRWVVEGEEANVSSSVIAPPPIDPGHEVLSDATGSAVVSAPAYSPNESQPRANSNAVASASFGAQSGPTSQVTFPSTFPNATANRYSSRGRPGARSRYVDTFGNKDADPGLMSGTGLVPLPPQLSQQHVQFTQLIPNPQLNLPANSECVHSPTKE